MAKPSSRLRLVYRYSIRAVQIQQKGRGKAFHPVLMLESTMGSHHGHGLSSIRSEEGRLSDLGLDPAHDTPDATLELAKTEGGLAESSAEGQGRESDEFVSPVSMLNSTVASRLQTSSSMAQE